MSESNPNQPTEKAMARAKEITSWVLTKWFSTCDMTFLAADWQSRNERMWSKRIEALRDILNLDFAHLIDEKEREITKVANERDMYINKLEQATTEAQEIVLQLLESKSQLTTAEARIAELEGKLKEATKEQKLEIELDKHVDCDCMSCRPWTT